MGILSPKLRYALVAGLCAVLYNAIMIFGDRSGVHYVLSYAVAFVVIVILGFCLHVAFTFEVAATWPSFFRYTAAMAVNAPLFLALMFLFRDVGQLSVSLASPLITGLMMIWNYIAGRWALVRGAS